MPGKLIVIDGLDGSGKATQAQLLEEYLRGKGYPVKKISFPDYDEPSSALVKLYLSGQVGTLEEVNVYAASGFYASDRYISYKRLWEREYRDGTHIVADRYTTSNIIHQMCRLPDEEWTGYIAWLQDYEYVRMGLPKPDLVLYLDMQPETAKKLIEKRYHGDESAKDIHEKNFAYLLQCRRAALFASDYLGWRRISCCEEGNPLPIAEIAQRIQDEINL